MRLDCPPHRTTAPTEWTVIGSPEATEHFTRPVVVESRCDVETVLSSDKCRPIVEDVLARNEFVWLLHVALSSPEIARKRVRGP
jgi:predicted ABC-type ATPase